MPDSHLDNSSEDYHKRMITGFKLLYPEGCKKKPCGCCSACESEDFLFVEGIVDSTKLEEWLKTQRQ